MRLRDNLCGCLIYSYDDELLNGNLLTSYKLTNKMIKEYTLLRILPP